MKKILLIPLTILLLFICWTGTPAQLLHSATPGNTLSQDNPALSKPGGPQSPPEPMLLPLIKQVTLIDKPGRKITDPLSPNLTIGIELNTPAYYIFSRGDQRIASGQLTTGLNLIIVPIGQWLNQPGFHSISHQLQLKADETMIQKEIILGIEVELPGISEPAYPSRYEISLLISGEVLGAIVKKVDQLKHLESLAKKQPYIIEHDPAFAPGANPSQYAAQVNPLALAFLAGKAIAKKIKKNKLARIQYIHTRHLQGTYGLAQKGNKPNLPTVNVTLHLKDNPPGKSLEKNQANDPGSQVL